jgi:protein-tyrosine phosphatase
VFIDLHAHILPDIDDGAIDAQESLAMLSMAEADFTVQMVATPHYIAGANQYTVESYERLLSELQDNLRHSGRKLDLLSGHEIMLDSLSVQHIQQGLCKPLGNSHTFLLELPVVSTLKSVSTLLERIMDMRYHLLIAHPERYSGFSIQMWQELKTMGCSFQMNAGSLTGASDELRKRAWVLLQEGLIHVVASDAHNSRRRTPTLSHARNLVAEHCGLEAAELLFHENPSRILQDMDLIIPSMTKRKKHFSIFTAFHSRHISPVLI